MEQAVARRARKRKGPPPRTWGQHWYFWMRDVLGAALWSVGVVDPGRLDQEVSEVWRTVKGAQEHMDKTEANGRAMVVRTIDRAGSILKGVPQAAA